MSSIADRRQAALEAFQRARAQGAGYNDWPGLAAELAALLPLAKPKHDATLGRAAWADYKAPRWKQLGYERTFFVATFADGEVVELCHPSDSRKPYNWGGAKRVAEEFWLLRKSVAWARARGTKKKDYYGNHFAYDVAERETRERWLRTSGKIPAVASLVCNGVSASIPEGV